MNSRPSWPALPDSLQAAIAYSGRQRIPSPADERPAHRTFPAECRYGPYPCPPQNGFVGPLPYLGSVGVDWTSCAPAVSLPEISLFACSSLRVPLPVCQRPRAQGIPVQPAQNSDAKTVPDGVTHLYARTGLQTRAEADPLGVRSPDAVLTENARVDSTPGA